MSRELRRVPEGWEHPKKIDGNYQPMFDQYYGDALDEWFKKHQQWKNGTHPDLIDNPERKEEFPFYAQWGGDPPDVDYYQTRKYKEEELTHIQLYETTSEGTPKSPVYRADQFDELCEWLADNCTTFADFKATKEEWKQMLNDGFVFVIKGNAMFF